MSIGVPAGMLQDVPRLHAAIIGIVERPCPLACHGLLSEAALARAAAGDSRRRSTHRRQAVSARRPAEPDRPITSQRPGDTLAPQPGRRITSKKQRHHQREENARAAQHQPTRAWRSNCLPVPKDPASIAVPCRQGALRAFRVGQIAALDYDARLNDVVSTVKEGERWQNETASRPSLAARSCWICFDWMSDRRWRWSAHPIHVMMVHFPIAFVIATLGVDVFLLVVGRTPSGCASAFGRRAWLFGAASPPASSVPGNCCWSAVIPAFWKQAGPMPWRR